MNSGPRKHGGFEAFELRGLGLDPNQVLDFSVSCNPYGPCREVIDAVRATPLDRYPDPTALPAREAIAASVGVDAACVALGNGACELLWTLAQVLVQPGTKVLIVEPTFCEFRMAAERLGGRVHEWRAKPDRGFVVDLEAISRLAHSCEAAVIYLCTPNTPTGASVRATHVARLAESNPDVAIVLDQSFLGLSPYFDDVRVHLPANVVCVRSMTKEHALAGIRVGYLVAAPALVARLEASRPSWTTNALAQAAAIAACEAHEFIAHSRRQVLDDLAELAHGLSGLGLAPVHSTTCFSIVRVGDAATVRQQLLATHSILVRDCSSFGLSEYIRVAARPKLERERLFTALKRELSS